MWRNGSPMDVIDSRFWFTYGLLLPTKGWLASLGGEPRGALGHRRIPGAGQCRPDASPRLLVHQQRAVIDRSGVTEITPELASSSPA